MPLQVYGIVGILPPQPKIARNLNRLAGFLVAKPFAGNPNNFIGTNRGRTRKLQIATCGKHLK